MIQQPGHVMNHQWQHRGPVPNYPPRPYNGTAQYNYGYLGKDAYDYTNAPRSRHDEVGLTLPADLLSSSIESKPQEPNEEPWSPFRMMHDRQ